MKAAGRRAIAPDTAAAASDGVPAKEVPAEGDRAALPAKTCSCTGLRWCAACRAPERRNAWGLRPPIELPGFLSRRRDPAGLRDRAEPAVRPVRVGRTACGSAVHEFDPETQSVPGLPGFSGVLLLRDFVSEAEADALVAEIERTPFAPAQSGKSKQHFGPRTNFRRRRMNADRFEGLPGYGPAIEARLRERLRTRPPNGALPEGLAAPLARYVTTDVFVLRYLEREAANLDVHVDDEWAYGEVILDLSLGSDGWMTFLDRDPQDGGSAPYTCVRVPLPARSLAVLFGPARSCWYHGIVAGDVRGCRTSITLRTLGDAARETDAGREVLARAGRVLGGGPARMPGA